MTDFVIAPPVVTHIPVATGGVFPVRRVYCVGRNYAEHAREMGSDPNREAPFFFSKPGNAITTSSLVAYPPATQNLHHEVELVLALGQGGRDLSPESALETVYASGVGVDLTRRDLQAEAKAAGRPWDMAKGFDQSGPVGTLVPGPVPQSGKISLSVNEVPRQSGDVADMIWSSAEIIAHLSRLVELAPGDLIFTGTPAGVGPVQPKDILSASIDGLPSLEFRMGEAG